MFELLLRILLAYFLGSVMGAMIVGRLRGIDILSYGSGNPGTTNVFRVLGKQWGLLVLLIDSSKGLLAVLVVGNLPIASALSSSSILPGWQPVFCGAAALLGHARPIFFEFRGGKGVATGAGALLGLAPVAIFLLLCVYGLVLVFTGYASLAALVAAALLPATVLVSISPPQLMPRLLLAIGIALFILYMHKDNISRLRDGSEHRFYRAMLWREYKLKQREKTRRKPNK